jgi:hypothetical protein
MMALGAMAAHADLDVKIVPCGLNYFHADRVGFFKYIKKKPLKNAKQKFRSRAVIEFGEPISVPADLVTMYRAGGNDKRLATGKLLEQILMGIKVNFYLWFSECDANEILFLVILGAIPLSSPSQFARQTMTT